MQTVTFLYAALLSAVTLVAGQSSSSSMTTTKAPTPSQVFFHPKAGIANGFPFLTFRMQTSVAVGELNSFLSDLRGRPEFSSFATFLGNGAIPSSVTNIQDGVPAITTRSEFSALPTQAQSYFSSVYNAEQSIIRKDLSGAAPQPTGILMAAGAAAAGVLGVAAMM